MSALFNDRQLKTLTAFCDTLIPMLDCAPDPHGLYARAASVLHVAEAIDAALPTVIDTASQTQLRLFLEALEQPLINGLLDGIAKPFSGMTLDERTLLLKRWSESAIPQRRQAFQALKRLAFFMFYSVLDAQGSNPNWAALGYAAPPPAPSDTAKPIRPLHIDRDSVLTADVVIVGSGAGGGVVAGELSAAGFDVIVIEKGGYHAEADYDNLELPSNQRLFENKGFVATADLGVLILAGSTLGGGTVINWSASFRTPDPVLQEWERDYGVSGLTSADYQNALDSVSQRINVNEQESACNGQNNVLENGAKALGYTVKTIPRNVKGCEECGFCNFGCQFGAKQSTLKTYLQDAFERGSRMIVDTDVERVLIAHGEAVGVEAITRGADGQAIHVTVRARAVVISAGSLHTPALLMRSGLTNAHIGRNLHLHPTTVTYGVYDALINGWQGPPMSRYVSQFTDADGSGYGFVLETAPLHPGIAALSLSWSDGAQHKGVMANLNHLSNIITIIRDHDGGRVTLDKQKRPVLHYTLSARDTANLARGVAESLRIHAAAGAHEISKPYSAPHILRIGALTQAEQQAALETFLASSGSSAEAWRKNGFALFSAHQMSSCRMAGSPASGAIDPAGETFEVCNLFVADGSALPTAVGRNPMLTIMAVSHQVAQHVKARLQTH